MRRFLFPHLAAQVHALDDILDRFLLDQDVSDLGRVHQVADHLGARVLVSLEAHQVGELTHAFAGQPSVQISGRRSACERSLRKNFNGLCFASRFFISTN